MLGLATDLIAELGGRIGYCAQQAWILNATVRDNVLFGQPFDEKRFVQFLAQIVRS